jgi:hypothetical protein
VGELWPGRTPTRASTPEHAVVVVASNPMARWSLTTGGRCRWSPRRAPPPPCRPPPLYSRVSVAVALACSSVSAGIASPCSLSRATVASPYSPSNAIAPRSSLDCPSLFSARGRERPVLPACTRASAKCRVL